MPVFAGVIDKCVVLGVFRAVLDEKRVTYRFMFRHVKAPDVAGAFTMGILLSSRCLLVIIVFLFFKALV